LKKVYFSVQRMGRTGRKREGRIVVLVTEGAEERKYNTSLLSKKAINKVRNKTGFLIHIQSGQGENVLGGGSPS
jgi:Fanconi anemia group M protein